MELPEIVGDELAAAALGAGTGTDRHRRFHHGQLLQVDAGRAESAAGPAPGRRSTGTTSRPIGMWSSRWPAISISNWSGCRPRPGTGITAERCRGRRRRADRGRHPEPYRLPLRLSGRLPRRSPTSPIRPALWSSGTCAIRSAPPRSPWTTGMSTSRSAAPTSSSAPVPAHRRCATSMPGTTSSIDQPIWGWLGRARFVRDGAGLRAGSRVSGPCCPAPRRCSASWRSGRAPR